jgi:myo-inositol 2-dehydrogenase / D-chiro-inositol 1-dehydrogenase
MGATIAVIGLGRIGAFHAETLSGLAGVDELVVTDERAEVTSVVAERLGARPVPDAHTALAAGIDAVVIAAATPAHARLILAAVDVGIPVFCEKPIAFTAAESRDVVARLARSDVPVQIGYNRRFDPAYVAAYDAVRAGELGRLTTVRSTTMDPAPPPPAYVAASGGIFRDCSVHDFDIVRWIVGRDVVEVYATGTNHGEAMFAEAGDAATAQTLLTFDDGTLGVVSNTRYNGRGYDCRLELHGSADTVVAGWDSNVPVRNLAAGEAFPTGAAHQFFMDRFADAYRAELSAFLDVATGRRASPCTPQEALEVAWMAEAATLSLNQRRPISMEEVRS